VSAWGGRMLCNVPTWSQYPICTQRLRVSKSVPPSEVNPRSSVLALFTPICSHPQGLKPQTQLSPARSSLRRDEKKNCATDPSYGN